MRPLPGGSGRLKGWCATAGRVTGHSFLRPRGRKLTPCLFIENPPRGLWVSAAPLLEKECHPRIDALIPKFSHPLLIDNSGTIS